MTDKTDGPAKDAARGADAPGVKRPHATLDLKATEVKPAEAAKPAEAPKQASTSSTGPQPSSASSSAQANASGGAASAGAGKATAQPASPAAAGPAATKPQAKDGSGAFGRFFSHLAAGLVGGGLVYAGAAYLPETGLTLVGTHTAEEVQRLEARLKALESAETTDPRLTRQLADASDRLAKVEGLAETVAALKTQQDALTAEAKSLGDKIAREASTPAERQEVAALKERLDLIAQGAGAADGKLPQLAALTGKIADLETSIATQVASLRKSLPVDVDARLAAASEASEAAKAGAQRIDRDVTQLRSEQAKLAQRAEATKADFDRIAAALDAAKEETGRLASTVGELKAMVENRVAKPADVSAAVTPVASKVAALEQNLASVVRSEEERKANAERIVLSLELQNLKRALDRGMGYSAELAEVRKVSQGRVDLGALERYQETGVATVSELQAEFRPLMDAVVDADGEPAEGSVIDRLMAGAKSIVRVRKVSHDPADMSAEAVVSRMNAALEAGQLGQVLELAKTVPQRASAPIQDWLAKVAARTAVDKAIAGIEGQLKASLSGSAAIPGEAAKPASKEMN